jgi:hypothetical protein
MSARYFKQFSAAQRVINAYSLNLRSYLHIVSVVRLHRAIEVLDNFISTYVPVRFSDILFILLLGCCAIEVLEFRNCFGLVCSMFLIDLPYIFGLLLSMSSFIKHLRQS